MYKSRYNLMLAKSSFLLKVVSPILFSFFFFNASAQTESEIGLPFITNYAAKTFKALPQTWSIQEDAEGIMYFGVQNFIMSYDGVKWRKIVFKVNSASTVVRSLTKNKEGIIYYGGYGDLGYLTKDSMGQTITKSLLDIIPAANRNFLDVWSAYSTDNSVYFQSREYIFRIAEKKPGGTDKDREVKVWKPQTKFMYSFYVDGDFYVHQQGLGLFKMVNDSLVLVPGSEFLGKERMQVMLPYPAGPAGEKQYLVGMFYSGLYIYNGKTFRPFATDADPILKSGAILYKGIQLPNGNYALSSTGIGLLIIDAKGKLLQRINRSVGLQDESIYATYLDKKGTLWLAMDNGISRVDISSPLTQFNLQSGITTGVLSIVRFESDLYIGTTNGLLHFNKETKRFELVQGIPQNQVFVLLPDGNELLVSGDGLFAIKNKKVFTIRQSVSADLTLSVLYIPKTDSNLLLGGGQFGVAVFKRKNKTANWDFKGYIPGITDQIWTFAENKDGTFWAGSANGWDYRVNIAFDESGNLDKKKTSFIKYGVKDGYTNGVGAVVTIHDINYFVADSSLFTFDDTKKQFVIDTTFGRFSKGAGATELTMGEDSKGIVWIKIGKEFRKAIPQPGGGYKIEPANLNAINEFTVGTFFPEKNILWIGTTDGLIRYDENLQKKYDESFKAILTHVSAEKETLSTEKGNKKASSISYKNNTLRFEYAAPFFEQEDKTQYQTWLEGFEKNWSDLGNNYYKEYTNLSPGKYTFRVRAVNIYNKQSDEATYSFEILPPWYRTWWAYLLYALVAAGAIYSLIRWRTRQLHEKHRELEKEVAQRTKELSHRVEELAVINSVQEGLVKEVGMQGIYELVGEKIREIFNAQIFDIVTYDSATNLLEDHYSYEKGDRTLAGKWAPSGFRKMVIESKQPLIINKDLDKRSREVNSQVLMGEQPKSALFVPLMSAGNVTGMISLQDIDKENAFPESSVNLLTTLANSMSVALESARRFDTTNRLLKETEERNAQLAVINSVQESLVAKLDMQGIYELVGEKIREIFDAQVIDIVTYDPATKQIEDRYAYEKGDRTLLGKREVAGFRKHVIQTKQLLLHNANVEKATREFNNPILIGEMPKSQIYVPMMSGDHVTGIISLQNLDHEHAFSESDVNLLTTLVNSMSVALESARLFDETARLLKETEQRNAELAIINSVQEGLASKLEMQAIYDLVGNKIQGIFDAQVVDIVTYNPATKLIYPRYVIERGVRFYEEPRSLIGMRKHVVETRQCLLVNEDIGTANIKYDNPAVVMGEASKSVLFVPMIVGREVKGIISLQNLDHENAFTESDVKLLTTLVNSMSIALESARLFDETTRLLKETEQRTAELGVINSVQEGLSKELDINAIYTMVGERIQHLFNAQVVGISTLNIEDGTEKFEYIVEKGKRFYPEPRPLGKLRLHMIKTKEKVIINKQEEGYAWFGKEVVPGTEPIKSAVFVPLMIGDKITSYVTLQNIDQENAFSPSDIRLLGTLANSMSVALENARLFDETTRLLKETEQRTAELAVINSVQDGLAKELDMQGIYDLIGNRVQKLFNAQVVIIASFDHEKKYESFNYAIEKGERIYSVSRPYDKVRQHLIDTGQNILINENFQKAAAEFGMKVISGTEMPKSLLFMPLKVGDKVNGYVSLQNIDQENAFSFSDVRLLGTLSNSMSVALENARLFDETNRLLKETEQRTAELGVINSVQDGLAKELDMQGIYELVGEKMREIFSAQVIDIVTYDKRTNLIEDRYSYEKGDRTLVGPREPAGFRKHVIQTKQLLLHNENVEQATKDFDNKIIIGEMPKSQIYVPMIAVGEVTGIISLQNLDHEHAFSDSDVNLITTLVNSMGVALESARLFDETTRLLKETEQRTAELGIINSVQQGLASKLDMQSIYDLVGEKIRELFNAQVIDIVSYDKLAGTIEDRYTFEKGDRTLLGSRPLKGFRRYVITTAKPLVINKDVDGERPKYDNTVLHGEAAKSLVMVPMIAGNEVTGAVSLQNLDKENAFSESDVNLLITLSSSMSVALESAKRFDETKRLLKETEQRTAELGIINSVQEGLGSKLDIQAIYDLVGDKIRNVFDTQGIAIAYYDREKNYINNQYYLYKGKRIYDYGFELGKGLTSHIIQTAQPLLINENAIERYKELGAIFAPSETEDAAKSWLGLPLITGGQVNGIIRLENYEREHAYTESDVSLLQTLANSMSVALENARLFDETNRLLKETEQRTAELAVINSVQEGLAKELNMQGIYDLVGDRLCDLFPDTQTLVIRTFDHTTEMDHFHYAIEKGERFPIDARPFNWTSKELIETKKSLDIRENYLEIAKKHGGTGVTKGQPPKSAVFVPMIVGDVVKGSVSLQNVDKENSFTDADLRLLTTITNSMSVALENARLFDETNRLLKETKQRTEELGVINSVQEELVREINIQKIYDLVGDRICELFDTQTLIIRTFDHQMGMESFHYAIEKGVHLERIQQPFMWANKLMIENKQPLLINENYAETAHKHGGKGVGKGLPPKSAIFVPMLVGDVVKGSVSLQNVEKEHAFTESDLRLLTTLTNSMSVALENARLFDETTHLLADAKQRASELSTVNSISKALASQLDSEELIQLVGDQLKGMFNANIVYLAILNKKTNMIYFPYQFGDDMQPLKLGDGLTSKVILSGEPVLLNKDILELKAQQGMKRIGKPSTSYLGVPIPVGDEIVGVMSVQSTEHENRFNENDMRLLSTIASSVGVALKNAQLFEEVQEAKLVAEEASKTAEKANHAKSAFLSTVSHELRTPLTSVLGFAKIINKRLDEKIFPLVDKKDTKTNKTVNQITENLKVVISEGERLTHLINDVLDLAKIEAGKMEWNLEDVNMVEVAERAIAATTSLFVQKDLKLIKKIDSDLPDISGDRDKLIQVIINLISNSVKFTDKGSITCTLSRKANELIVSIADTGIGIAKEDYDAVFEQFKQVGGDTLTDKPKGTGLGLPICKEIVEHHGGRIWLDSVVGKGSVFSFALPITPTTSIPMKPIHLNDLVKQLKEQMAFSKLKVDGKNATILVVDDDESIRSLLHQELSDAGYLIEEAANGKDALDSIRKNRPDLIILDVMMPEINGFDVAAILKNDPQTMDIPIIVLSIVQDKARGFRIGVDRYLTKPIDTAQLFAEVGTLLEQGKSKKKVMVVDEDGAAVRSLTDVLQAKGYHVVESDGKELVEKAIATQPDIIILNSVLSANQEIVQTLRFEKGLENVLFFIYQ